jgi:serine/threonine-protein kinase
MGHTSAVSFTVGQVVDHYRLDEVVAESAEVTVFAAFDLRLLRRVALKALDADLGANGAFRARFAFEAAAAAQLDHPGIVSVYDSNEHDGLLYFVTKFVDGESLDGLLRSRPTTIAESMIYL